jgi:hypothetical protein
MNTQNTTTKNNLEEKKTAAQKDIDRQNEEIIEKLNNFQKTLMEKDENGNYIKTNDVVAHAFKLANTEKKKHKNGTYHFVLNERATVLCTKELDRRKEEKLAEKILLQENI